MSRYVEAKHGVVCSVEQGPGNYFGWPSVAKLDDGTVVAGASGFRWDHICPFGKSVLCYSKDQGETFDVPQVVHNDLIDNRDVGVIALGGGKFGITWFSLDVRVYDMSRWMTQEQYAACLEYMDTWKDDTVQTLVGSWTKITQDGGRTWTRPIRVPVSAPHGYIVLRDGSLGYLGKGFREDLNGPGGDLQYVVSRDGGFTWSVVGTVPLPEGESRKDYHEPHVIELQDGRLMGAIRYHIKRERKAGDTHGEGLDTCLVFSEDGGRSWTEPKRMHVGGSPPHLLRHSSGAIVMTYGWRSPGYGQRAVVSWDEGQSWSEELIIRDDGERDDLGYPCSVELNDGSIYTVYYQPLPGKHAASLQWSRWKLPENRKGNEV